MSIKINSGQLNGKGQKHAIIISRFNELLTSKLLEGAVDCLSRHGVAEKDIQVFWVPGAYEIPYVAQKAALSKKFDAVICLGAIIRGDTPHFDFIANEAAKGIASLALDTRLPIMFGIITADTLDQAIERAGTKAGNKGWDASLAAIEMIDLYKQIDKI
ncbi:MAG: 6,7-dimethyl-8-ribityllumazine synthase [candidate division Zixibacteria bacterium]|nr:6,7-dimethyl-8-ribityllumazine synthase [candidate division Zixibacteria bacterium]